MTLAVTHTYTDPIADDPNAAAQGLVLPSHWNAAHTLTGKASAAQIDLTDTYVWTGVHTWAAGTLTASNPQTITQTWNNNAVGFYGVVIDITTTSALSASYALDIRSAGTSVWSVRKDGGMFVPNGTAVGSGNDIGIGWNSPSTLGLRASGILGFTSAANGLGAPDTAFARNAAGVMEVNNGTAGTYRDILARTARTPGVAFASLPTGVAGMVAYVTDSNTTTWGATVAGSGANKVLAWFNGTNWTVIGA